LRKSVFIIIYFVKEAFLFHIYRKDFHCLEEKIDYKTIKFSKLVVFYYTGNIFKEDIFIASTP